MITFVRTIVMYLIVILVMRLMGKRQIGQLQPYEFVITIMISDLASFPMQDSSIPLWHGIVPILCLLFLQISISFAVLKVKNVRGFFCGKPCIVVKDGIVYEKVLRKQLYTLDDLLEALRLKGVPDVEDVQLAILENNGELSVIPKSEAQFVTKGDMKIESAPETVTDLIIGGALIEENMRSLSINKDFLMNILEKNDIKSIRDVFYCYVNGDGIVKVQKKMVK